MSAPEGTAGSGNAGIGTRRGGAARGAGIVWARDVVAKGSTGGFIAAISALHYPAAGRR
jgi:hypothetical protein